MMVDNKVLKDLNKEAKISQQKKSYEDGMVQATVNGVKNMFPLQNVKIIDRNGKKFTVLDLVKQVDNQNERIDKLVEINKKMLEKINKLEGKVNTWIG